jgi:diguanylate cyclase (GGDEF)-like protein/PAS domain S-box-containing protein
MLKVIGKYNSIKEHPRFGKICIDLGFISEEQLKTALDDQVENNISNQPHINLGKILLNKKLITYEQILAVLDKIRENEHNVTDFIKAIKRDIRVLSLVVLLIAFVLVFLNLSFLSAILNYLPPFSVAMLFIVVFGLVSISIFLSRHIARKSIEELEEYDRRMKGILNSLHKERKKREDEIRFQSQQDWEGTFNTINDLITIHDKDFNIIHSNHAAKKTLQLPDLEVNKAVKCFKYYHGTDCPPEECPSYKCFETGLPASFEMFEPHLKKYVEMRIIPRFNADKQITGLIHIVRDITERKKSEEKYHSLVDSTDDSVYLIDRDYNYLFMNKQHLLRLGLSEKQYMNRAYSEFHSTEETELFAQKAETVFKTGKSFQYEYKSLRDDKSFFQTLSPVKNLNDETTAITVISKDITMLKHAEEMLYSMSITDELTGLYNRRGFLALSEQQLKLANRDKKRMFLMSADLDFLKLINDTVGHTRGDMAIMSIANILKKTFRDSDIAARIGGDEFVVLGMEAPDTNIETLAERLRENLKTHNAKENEPLEELSLSYGFASYDPEHPCSVEELLTNADRLMYEDKHKKR